MWPSILVRIHSLELDRLIYLKIFLVSIPSIPQQLWCICVKPKKKEEKRTKKNLKRRANGKRTYSRERSVVKKRPTQPSVLSVLKALLATRTIIFLSLITSLITSRTSHLPCLQAFIFGKRIPYISPQLIPILKAPVSHSSSLDSERERVCVLRSLYVSSLPLLSSSSYLHTSFFQI